MGDSKCCHITLKNKSDKLSFVHEDAFKAAIDFPAGVLTHFGCTLFHWSVSHFSIQSTSVPLARANVDAEPNKRCDHCDGVTGDYYALGADGAQKRL